MNFLLQEKYGDGFLKFCEKASIEEQKISTNHMEKMEHTIKNCEDALMDNDPLFLDELFTEECDHSGEKIFIENLKFRALFEKKKLKKKLDSSIFTFDEPTND